MQVPIRCCICATQAVPIADWHQANKTRHACHTGESCPLQDGMPCRNPVNIDTCPYCDYHVGSEYKKVQSKRGQFAESKLHSAFKQQNGKGQSGVRSFKQSASRVARARRAVLVQLVLLHLLLRLQLQQTTPRFRWLHRHFHNSAVVANLWQHAESKQLSNAVHWPWPPKFRLPRSFQGATPSAACPVLQQVQLPAHALSYADSLIAACRSQSGQQTPTDDREWGGSGRPAAEDEVA